MSKTFKLVSFFLFFLIFSTYVPNHKVNSQSYIFPIKIIKLVNNKIINSKKLMHELSYLEGKNLFFLNQDTLTKIIMNHDFIMNFQVKKIYPHTIKIIVTEKSPIAIFSNDTNKFYISEKGELITYKKFDYYNNLPIVFAKNISFKKIKFNNIFSEMKEMNFPIHEIKSFIYFDIKRWDIILKNNKIVKLPVENYGKILKQFLLIKNEKNFKRYKLFDYRVKNQLILN
jgi:cell division protein FtsQ|tara:strand:+ start:82 stop:765 length:684 start_codon:yes stop_codon:yes gene_type:complete